MNKEEFKKTLSENDRYWEATSPAQRVMTPLLQLSLWIRHADFIGCYMTKAQRLRAKRCIEALNSEVRRLQATPRLHHPQSLAFIQARRLLDELQEKWFPSKPGRVVPFRRNT